MDKLLKYINSLPPDAREKFAAACGTTVGYLRKAVSRRQVLGNPLSFAIETASEGQVTRKDLHPESWRLNWPELSAAS
jgi:DNA-binding transcriptional regulator YdaS (Cro superfamily)